MKGAVQLGLDGVPEPQRPDDDFYATPRWLVDAALQAVFPGGFPGALILDAGCGDGRLLGAAADYALAFSGPFAHDGKAIGVDINADRLLHARVLHDDLCFVCWDFLEWAGRVGPGYGGFDLVISNPPFGVWDDFVRAMLPLVAPGGTCLVLGFVNVLGGQHRRDGGPGAAWWRENPPSRIWLSPRRASFTSDGQTDPRDVCWISWEPGPRNAEFRWLPTEREGR